MKASSRHSALFQRPGKHINRIPYIQVPIGLIDVAILASGVLNAICHADAAVKFGEIQRRRARGGSAPESGVIAGL